MFRRRQERREGRDATRYQMSQRVISIGDDYVIENDRGERVFKVDGKALRVRKTLLFEDMQGRELCKIQERMLRVKDSMEIEDPGGRRMAVVKKAMITPLRERGRTQTGSHRSVRPVGYRRTRSSSAAEPGSGHRCARPHHRSPPVST